MDKKLESRILRLERLLNKKSVKKSAKNESARDDVFRAATQWAKDYFDELDEDDPWVQRAGSVCDFLQVIADEDADPVVDSCCDDLEYEYDFELSDSDRDIVASALAAAAADAMTYMCDDEFESCKRANKYVSRKSTLEQRIDKLERLLRR